MEVRAFQGLILGGIVGVALFAFLFAYNHNPISLILIPIGAFMGYAPHLLKPKDD